MERRDDLTFRRFLIELTFEIAAPAPQLPIGTEATGVERGRGDRTPILALPDLRGQFTVLAVVSTLPALSVAVMVS